jgi:hypothetical protein
MAEWLLNARHALLVKLSLTPPKRKFDRLMRPDSLTDPTNRDIGAHRFVRKEKKHDKGIRTTGVHEGACKQVSMYEYNCKILVLEGN